MKQYIVRNSLSIYLYTLACLAMLMNTSVVLAEIEILEDFRSESLVEGQGNVYLSIEDQNYQQVLVYYRVSGSDLFMPVSLAKNNNKWLWRLIPSQVWAPGIEYYFEAILKSGDRETKPKAFPNYNPLSIVVKGKHEIELAIASASAESVALKLGGTLEEGSRIFLGDIDVSDFVQYQGDQLVIDTSIFDAQDLSYVSIQSAQGELLASLDLPELQGSGSGAETGDHYVKLSGNASLNIGGQDAWEEDKQERSITGNLGLGAEYRNGEFTASFEGFNANYQHGAEEEVKLGTGYLLSMKYRQTALEIGDVTTKGTPLVMSGFSRRGMKASSEGDSWKGEVFNVRTAPIDGWESGISFDDRQTYGASYEHNLGSDSPTKILLSVVSGDLKNDDAASNVGSSSTTEQSGDSLGLQLTTNVSGFGIDAQLAGSKFDDDTNDSADAEQDEAYELSLSKDIYGLASSLGYQRYGANYATIANPNFSGDREGYDLSLGSSWKDLGWQASFSSTRDNIDEDVNRAVVTSNNYGISSSLNYHQWPSLNLGYNLSQQSSEDEPSASDEIDNTGFDVNLGLSDSIGLLNWSWSSSFGRIEDKLNNSSKSDTSNHGLSLSRNFSVGDVNVSASRNRQRSDIVSYTDLLSLALSVPLFSEKFMLNTQFSGQNNRTSDDSVDTVIIGGSARLAWSLQDMVTIRGLEWANPQFSLTWTTNRHKDNNDYSKITDDNSLVLEFSMGAPYQFEHTWFINDEIYEGVRD